MTLPSEVEKRISASHLAVLRSAIADHHVKHGTTQPLVDALTVTDSYPMSATVHVKGDGYEMQTILNVRGGIVEGNGVEMIVRNAEKEYLWRAERAASAEASKTQIERVMARMGGKLNETKGSHLSDTSGNVVIVYYLTATVIGGAMQEVAINVSVSHHPASDRWWDNVTPTLAAGYKRNARRLEQTAPLMVCSLLAKWMRNHKERGECAKRLFGAANGAKGTKIPWRNLTNLEARDGRIVGTLGYSGGLRMRDGELIVKDKKLPETIVSAMRGRRVAEVFEHALFGDMTIARARNTANGLVIVVNAKPEPYKALFQELNT